MVVIMTYIRTRITHHPRISHLHHLITASSQDHRNIRSPAAPTSISSFSSMSWILVLFGALIALGLKFAQCEDVQYGHPKNSLSEQATLAREFDLDLRSQNDLTPSSVIPQEQLMKIIAGAEKGNKDNLYYLGILKLYGITLGRDVKGAAHYFTKAANLGHADSQTAVGMMKLKGTGMEVDPVGAMNMFRRAVEQDNSNGYWLLGKMLLEGRGAIKANYVEAFMLLQKAADRHIPQAEHQLGVMYEYGLGVPQNFKKAMEFYTRAAEQKYVESMYHAALMHFYGRSGAVAYPQALALLEAGALSSHGPSAYYMGIAKTYGYGTNIDYAEAMHWFDLAATSGDERVSEEAFNNAQELNGLLKEAEAHNRAVQDSYRLRQEEGAGL